MKPEETEEPSIGGIRMKKVSLLICLVTLSLMTMAAGSWAMDAQLSTKNLKAGSPLTVSGTITPGTDLYVVVASDKMFTAAEAPGPKEKKRLAEGKGGKNAFGDTAIPATYYVLTSNPDSLATPKTADKGQTSGIFAFPPFKYQVKVNKIKKWGDINPAVAAMLGPVNNEAQWKFLTFTHEKKFGINTVSKEKPIGGGNARMIMSDSGKQPESWNEGVSVSLTKTPANFPPP